MKSKILGGKETKNLSELARKIADMDHEGIDGTYEEAQKEARSVAQEVHDENSPFPPEFLEEAIIRIFIRKGFSGRG